MSDAIRLKSSLACTLCLILLVGCRGERLPIGIAAATLSACPPTPNCVSSAADSERHAIAPFTIVGKAEAAWRALHEVVAGMKRTEVITDSDDYLHVECASRLFGFVDDLEFQLRAGENLIAVRSASRIGYTDHGVNRRRVEHVAERMRERGVIE
ncbi:MAG: DUF1499 domain-containing protein [Gammaproteobacteria bacterium]|nr:DUF1499 domain-containing protein [Gammaproteobacteria bacterium]